jgi:hypothetical protein
MKTAQTATNPVMGIGQLTSKLIVNHLSGDTEKPLVVISANMKTANGSYTQNRNIKKKSRNSIFRLLFNAF